MYVIACWGAWHRNRIGSIGSELLAVDAGSVAISQCVDVKIAACDINPVGSFARLQSAACLRVFAQGCT